MSDLSHCELCLHSGRTTSPILHRFSVGAYDQGQVHLASAGCSDGDRCSQNLYAGHSFRIWVATAAASAGVEDSTIQTMGPFQRYAPGPFDGACAHIPQNKLAGGRWMRQLKPHRGHVISARPSSCEGLGDNPAREFAHAPAACDPPTVAVVGQGRGAAAGRGANSK